LDRNSEITDHNQRNAELVRAFSSKQVDLHQARSVELHFWAWGQPNSVRLARELYQQGFIVLVLKPAFIEDGKDRWNIEAGSKMSIESVIASDFTARLVDLASRFDAEYDGWGTSV